MSGRRRARRRIAAAGCVVGAAFALAPWPAANGATGTLDAVRERGTLRCGVSDEAVPGFAVQEGSGEWRGFDVDYCRAIAAAVLGDAAAVAFVPVGTAGRFDAVATGDVDVLARNTAWTLSRDVLLPIDFPAVTFFDGQGFLVPRGLGVRSALELDGARVCVLDATTTRSNLADFFATHLMESVPVPFRSTDAMFAAYDDGLCDAVTADLSRLAGARELLAEGGAHVLLPEIVAKEPLALAVAEDDPAWADIVRWVHMALLAAEERGVAQADVATLEGEPDPGLRRLLGLEGEVGHALGLAPDWAVAAIAAVGHYGEIFARHLGPATALNLERGPNALWRDGGLHYPLPLR